jgi:hypothetical protein
LERTSTETTYSTTEVENLEVTKFQDYSTRHLYSQQLIGAYTISMVKRCLVAYDMRVGKTMTLIAAAKHAIEMGEVDFIFILCPKMNMYDPWVPELTREGLRPVVLDESEAEDIELIKLRAYNQTPDKYNAPLAFICNYERLPSRLQYIQEHWDMSRVFVGMDETSAIKNPSARRTRACQELCRYPAPYVVLLNGTPMEQGPQDLEAQLRCVDPLGLRIGATYGDFTNRWLKEISPGKFRVKTDMETRMSFDAMLASLSIRYIRSEADQFSGKDKAFRYIKIKNTVQQAEQARNVVDGFVRTMHDGAEKQQSLSDLLIVTYGFLREISCGYDKYREDEDSPYIRVRHEFDPKVLWVLCHLESCPGEPLVVYCEYNEQEQRLKEELDARGISWSSTAPKLTESQRMKFKDQLKKSTMDLIWAQFPNMPRIVPWEMGEYYQTPDYLRYDNEAAQWVDNHPTLWRDNITEYYSVYKKKNYSPEQRAAQVLKFNEGDAQVFICKTNQARGFGLHRNEAVEASIGGRPSIIYLAPPWSLGVFEQSQDRCVAVDKQTGRNVCTPVIALAVPGIEQMILTALRAKKDVQTALLKDADRVGFESFVQGLVEDMEKAALTADGESFDPEEMFARMECGVPPGSKLKDSLILGKLMEKHPETGNSRVKVKEWVINNPEHKWAKAATLLINMVTE